ncbi:Cof-type HAD-IIB family hydrolase [uncultured Dubosiella sp.]|uniref:Cof-type HAD-IIB family hydrolase n=1 Tax=uncultured Dubosiella sp. TaxID=1937011 RepID=UPI0025932CEA|nr:Cof-type HAD-IIB family hydrolase [uncultured Dubosiella sp.]
MENIKLVLVDLDGTLLDDQKRVSAYTLDVLRRLKKAGIQFGICTGRTPYAVEQLLKTWNMDEVTDVIIGFNGGQIFDLHEQNSESIYEMDGAYIDEILAFLADFSFNAFVFDHYTLHALRDDAHAQTIARRNLLTIVEDGLAPYRAKKINKLLTSWDKDDLDRFLSTHTLRHPDYYMVRSTPTLLEFMDHRVSKGQGIQRLCERKGIHPAQILSFGDELNDLDMLENTVGVAMANANPLLFEKTRWRTRETNNEDGVARFLERYLLNC